MRPAVIRCDELEVALDRIAQRDAVLLIPKGDGVEEAIAVGVLELQGPGLAGIGRLVDARVFAGPGAEQVRRGVAERLDIAEIELLRSRDRADGPSLPAVTCAP